MEWKKLIYYTVKNCDIFLYKYNKKFCKIRQIIGEKKHSVWEELQKFYIGDLFSVKNQEADFKPKNFILQVITYFSIQSSYLGRHF